MAYFDVQLDARADVPTEDLLSGLLAAEVDGTRLTRAEVQGFCMTLMVAGNETTRSLVSGGMVELARHPDQRARLARDPKLIPPAVEEMLRWVTPIMAMARTTTRDVTLGGVELGMGEFVVLAYGAANRDEAVFGETADAFDIIPDAESPRLVRLRRALLHRGQPGPARGPGPPRRGPGPLARL